MEKSANSDIKQGVAAVSGTATEVTATAKNTVGEAKEKLQELHEPAREVDGVQCRSPGEAVAAGKITAGVGVDNRFPQ